MIAMCRLAFFHRILTLVVPHFLPPPGDSDPLGPINPNKPKTMPRPLKTPRQHVICPGYRDGLTTHTEPHCRVLPETIPQERLHRASRFSYVSPTVPWVHSADDSATPDPAGSAASSCRPACDLRIARETSRASRLLGKEDPGTSAQSTPWFRAGKRASFQAPRRYFGGGKPRIQHSRMPSFRSRALCSFCSLLSSNDSFSVVMIPTLFFCIAHLLTQG
jgi:hypothetical protein